MKAQRLRLRYAVGEAAAGRSQRDLLNAWGEAAKAAGLPISYSTGKKPAPQISVGALLPQGVTGSGELMDVFLDERIDPKEALERLRPQAPEGITLLDVEEVGPSTESLQQRLRWAEYEVEIPAAKLERSDVEQAIDRLLSSVTWPAQHRREKKTRKYDLRPLVLDVSVEGQRDGCLVLKMALRAGQDQNARADQVLRELGLPEAQRVHRTALHLSRVPEVVLRQRKEHV